MITIALLKNHQEEELPKPTIAPLLDGSLLFASHESGFYRSDIDLVLSTNKGARDILYTITDPSSYEEKETIEGEAYVYRGSYKPSHDNLDKEGPEKTYVYAGPISLKKERKQLRVYVIQVIIVDGEGRESETYTFTYILGDQFNFDNYFVHLSINEEDLHGHEKGILIKGKSYFDEIANNPKREINEFFPRNYWQRGLEWEREGFLQIFDNLGRLLIEQTVGVRVNGGMSRHYEVKALKIIARQEYGKTSIDYPIFFEKTNNYGNPIRSYDRFILRASANDFQGTMFKDLFIHKLASKFSLDYQDGTPCNVYINGKYYSLMNIRQSLDRDYVESMYNIPRDNVDIVTTSYSEGYKFFYRVSAGDESAKDDFLHDMNKILEKDYSKLSLEDMSEYLDLDNFIDYMAYEIYVANTDWPHNNVIAWRYRGPAIESVYGMDGKWRFVLKDLDYHNAFTNYSHDTLSAALSVTMSEGPCVGQILKAFMGNNDFKDLFLNKLLAYSQKISASIVTDLLKEMKKERENDIKVFWDYYDLDKKKSDRLINSFILFAKERPAYIRKIVEEFF